MEGQGKHYETRRNTNESHYKLIPTQIKQRDKKKQWETPRNTVKQPRTLST